MQSEINIKEGVSNIVGGNILELESERLAKKAKIELAVIWLSDGTVSVDKAVEQTGLSKEELLREVELYKKKVRNNE